MDVINRCLKSHSYIACRKKTMDRKYGNIWYQIELKCTSNKMDCDACVRVTRSVVLYACFVDRCLSFCTFSLGHCVVCSSSIYGF